MSTQSSSTRSTSVTSRCELAAGQKSDATADNANNFKFAHGDFEVSVISDGYLSIPEDIFTHDATPDTRGEVLSRLDTVAGTVRTPTNIAVLRSKTDLILFDIGGGDRYQPSDGKFIHNLRAAGFDEADVTKVVVTHAHPDHIGAMLAADGRLQFSNATYYVGAAEWNFWMDRDFFRKQPEALHVFARGTQRDLSAIENRVVMMNPGDDVVRGIRAIDTAGHTPGHLSFEVSGGDGLIIVADAATSEIVAFEHPDWTFGYDTLPDTAIRNRKRLIDRAAADKTKLLGFHWTYPGVGNAETSGSAFRFIPII